MEPLIDTHAHLDFPEFSADLERFLDRAAEKGVAEIITIGIDEASSRKAVELAETHPQIHATTGVHPHDSFDLDDAVLNALRALARRPRVVAYGEIGLDYFRNYKPREIQIRCFEQQLELASEIRLPVVFHVRDAYDDFFRIVGPLAHRLAGGILHCFSGDWEIARRCIEMGFYLSIPGTVTYPKSLVQQDVVRRAPFDRLLVETDAPYLTPVPFRGKPNEPSYVVHTAAKVAELRGCSFEETARQTTLNARKAFGLDACGTSAGAGMGPMSAVLPTPILFRTLAPLVLASGSPRRKDLLEGLGLTFDVVPSGVAESGSRDELPAEMVKRWAHEKALAVSLRLPERWVLAADTLVLLDGAVLGKPSGPAEAAEMLRRLSGKVHEVLTGICLLHQGGNAFRLQCVRTEVLFKDLSQEEIDSYVRTGEPLDKAGAYGIQGMGAFLVRSIRGSYTNVVGLPLCETMEWLIQAGVAAPARQSREDKCSCLQP